MGVCVSLGGGVPGAWAEVPILPLMEMATVFVAPGTGVELMAGQSRTLLTVMHCSSLAFWFSQSRSQQAGFCWGSGFIPGVWSKGVPGALLRSPWLGWGNYPHS